MMSQIDEHEIEPLGNSEKLGRDEWSRTSARRPFRRLKAEGKARVPASKFEPPNNTNEISVNRMDLAPTATLAELGARNASLSSKKFWGWYTLTAGDVEEVGCRIIPTPLDDNPFHADIVVPVALDAEDRKDSLSSPLKKALLTGFHSTAKHNATKAVSPSSETMRTI